MLLVTMVRNIDLINFEEDRICHFCRKPIILAQQLLQVSFKKV